MSYRVLVSETFQKQFSGLDHRIQERIRTAIAALEDDPFRPRPHADIKPLTATDPVKYRLRIGEFRIVFVVIGSEVRVIEVFRRGKGY